jgi:hypothetical protein
MYVHKEETMFKWLRSHFKKPKENIVLRTVSGNGNSWTVAIPPAWLKELNLTNKVELEKKMNYIIIRRKIT